MCLLANIGLILKLVDDSETLEIVGPVRDRPLCPGKSINLTRYVDQKKERRKGSRAFLTSLRFVNSLIFDQNRSTLALICPYHPIGLSILSHVEDAYKYHAYIHIDIHTARKTGVMNGIGIEMISGLQLVRHLCHARFLHEGRQGQARSPV